MTHLIAATCHTLQRRGSNENLSKTLEYRTEAVLIMAKVQGFGHTDFFAVAFINSIMTLIDTGKSM